MSFRVTDDEFEQLKSASGHQGARCLSDFARGVMLDGSRDHSAPDCCENKFRSLERRMASLERSLATLAETLALASR